MRCAIGADDRSPLTDALIDELERRAIEVDRYGALRAPSDAAHAQRDMRKGDVLRQVQDDTEWASIGRAVGAEVATGRAELGIVCCWTGTGISIAANKIRGVRAALCADAVTAQGARRWNDANVLALSLRATSPAVGREILDAFLAAAASDDPTDRRSIEAVE
jgi:ribose 5-phosphate isomerase B